MFKKVIKTVQLVASVFICLAMIALIVYQAQSIKDFLKNILKDILNEDTLKSISNILDLYLNKACLIIIAVSVVILLFSNVVKEVYFQSKRKNQNLCRNSNNLFESLYKYLEGNEKRCYIVIGYWGSGKTYNVNNFLTEYLKYRSREVYKISCFGLENRQEVLKEMKLMFENQDNSMQSHALKIVKAIPLIGEVLHNLFKPGYELKDIKKNSIFVFDDFERIANNLENVSYREYYKKDSFLFGGSGEQQYKEFVEIKKEFDKISDGFREMQSGIEILVKQKNLEKYNIVTGLINELIERYNMKVLILCNYEVVDSKYFRDIFEGKLECIKYKIKANYNLCNEIAVRNINDIVSLDKEKNELLVKFFNENYEEIDKVWEKTGIENTRVFSCIIRAFIDLIERTTLTNLKNEMNSIFYSILVGHVSYYSNDKTYEYIKTGENIVSFERKMKSLNPMSHYRYLDILQDKSYLIWYGRSIALSWLLGIHSSTDNIKDDIKEVKNYNRSLESIIANNVYSTDDIKELLFDDIVINIDDILFLSNEINENEKVNLLKLVFEKYKVDYKKVSYNNISYQCTQLYKVLNLMDEYNMYSILKDNNDLKDIIFSQLKTIFNMSELNQNFNLNNNNSQNVMCLYNQWVENNGYKVP